MTCLPANFRFSQASLADYLDCPRRFQLRYLLEQAWPAVESEPLLERERLAELGRRFHKLIQQHVEGLSTETLTESIGEPELARWWQSYLDSLAHDTERSTGRTPRRSGDVDSDPILSPHRALRPDRRDDDRAVIVDWKTEQRQPTRDQLLQRVQTRVYRYVLTLAQQRPPGTVSMIYWFAQYPDQPVTLPYDAAQHAAITNSRSSLIEEIENLARDSQRHAGFRMGQTPDERKCAYCVYRSLCNRGVHAGTSDPDEEDFDLVARINIEQIDAIEY